MADIKKYLSLERLAEYDALLKAKIAQDDASTLESAKEYVDGLIEDVNTSITNITNGDIVVKEAEHATSADSAITATSAESATKATQDGNGAIIADTYETKTDAAAKLDEAKEYTDNLKTYVGTIPEGATATDVVGYVQEKTAGIASEGAMTELSNRVGIVEGKVSTIEGDYLTSADKTELQTNIDTVSSAVELLTNGVDAETVDGVNDLIAYVNEHGAEVTGMKADIQANADALAELAPVAKTGSWNDLADRPFGEGGMTEITWDGDYTTNPDNYAENTAVGSGAKGWYYVSELVPSNEELQQGIYRVVENGVEHEYKISDVEPTLRDDWAMVAYDGGLRIFVSRVEYLYNEFPIEDIKLVYGVGIYFENERESADHVSYLAIPGGGVKTLDEIYIPSAIARVEELDAVETKVTANETAIGNLNTAISGKAAQVDLDSAVERVAALEAWHTEFEECTTEDINSLFNT